MDSPPLPPPALQAPAPARREWPTSSAFFLLEHSGADVFPPRSSLPPSFPNARHSTTPTPPLASRRGYGGCFFLREMSQREPSAAKARKSDGTGKNHQDTKDTKGKRTGSIPPVWLMVPSLCPLGVLG